MLLEMPFFMFRRINPLRRATGIVPLANRTTNNLTQSPVHIPVVINVTPK
jgi:hypothetical protein